MSMEIDDLKQTRATSKQQDLEAKHTWDKGSYWKIDELHSCGWIWQVELLCRPEHPARSWFLCRWLRSDCRQWVATPRLRGGCISDLDRIHESHITSVPLYQSQWIWFIENEIFSCSRSTSIKGQGMVDSIIRHNCVRLSPFGGKDLGKR